MQRMMIEDAAPEAGAGLAGAVYAPAWRSVIAALRVFSRAALLLVLGMLLVGSDVEMTPPVLFRAVTVLAALPALAAWLLERAFAAQLVVDGSDLVVRGRGRRLEIPLDALAGAEPWRVPLPRPGVSIVLRSGREIAVAVDDPGELLARIGLDDDAPIVLWAAARARSASGPRYRTLVQFPLFALVPGAILFRTHQWIAYGGTFGQYYLLGLRAYLVTFAVYWATVTIYLVLWANVWRLIAEAATLAAAHARPYRTTAFRRAAERAYGLFYYGGALLVLLVRLLP
jgi:apolipoprotein N-acyltransferase